MVGNFLLLFHEDTANIGVLENPILMAPIGVQSIFHEDAETGLSEVCSEIGAPYVLSTASSCSIEKVAKENGKGPRWF